MYSHVWGSHPAGEEEPHLHNIPFFFLNLKFINYYLGIGGRMGWNYKSQSEPASKPQQ